jgi:uncharacterized membrane protein YccC
MIAAVVGMILTFGVFPHIDGFPMLCVALAPALAFGTFLTTRPAYAGYGVGYCIFLCFLAGPDNVVQYNPSGYINDAFALVVSQIVSAAAFAVLLPPSTPWLRNRLLANLRGQAVHACRARLQRLPGIAGVAGLRNRFESGARDLMFQLNALAGKDEAFRQATLRWMFSTLEIGNAAIDLREELAALPDHPRFNTHAPWRTQTAATLKSVAALFERPDARRHAAALATTTAAIGAAQAVLEDVLREDAPREERHPLQRCLSHLHFIRTALIDPQSPFAAYADKRADDTNHPQGANHAS